MPQDIIVGLAFGHLGIIVSLEGLIVLYCISMHIGGLESHALTFLCGWH